MHLARRERAAEPGPADAAGGRAGAGGARRTRRGRPSWQDRWRRARHRGRLRERRGRPRERRGRGRQQRGRGRRLRRNGRLAGSAAAGCRRPVSSWLLRRPSRRHRRPGGRDGRPRSRRRCLSLRRAAGGQVPDPLVVGVVIGGRAQRRLLQAGPAAWTCRHRGPGAARPGGGRPGRAAPTAGPSRCCPGRSAQPGPASRTGQDRPSHNCPAGTARTGAGRTGRRPGPPASHRPTGYRATADQRVPAAIGCS